jgi:hypothetical protein
MRLQRELRTGARRQINITSFCVADARSEIRLLQQFKEATLDKAGAHPYFALQQKRLRPFLAAASPLRDAPKITRTSDCLACAILAPRPTLDVRAAHAGRTMKED